jgi:alpha-tubulin suppressor-like RCC1 family protein
MSLRPVAFVSLVTCTTAMLGCTDGTDSDDPNDTDQTASGPALTALAAGANATCAVLDDGTAKCWGDNRTGQLGDGTTTSSVTPVAVSGLTDAIAISTGYEFSCAIHAGGTVSCWGSGTNGRLGNGSSDNSSVPVPVSDLTGAEAIIAGFSTACALRDDGTVWCWGRGGELGSSTDLSDSNVPVQVEGLAGVGVLAGATHGGTSLSSHTCGVRDDGTAFCWGLGSDGQNGDGTQNSAREPVEVSEIDDATAITAGMTHACAVTGSGTQCWGSSQLVGDGTVERRFDPTPVSTSVAFTALTAGFEHTCGLTASGDVWCWGRNGGGQIGDGVELVSGDVRLEPAQADVSGVSLVAAGMTHTCAYDSQGVTSCWGRNEYGEIGSGTPGSAERSSVPAPVAW